MKTNGYQIDMKYQLCGLIEHFGSASGGHYIAYRPLFSEVKDNKTWVICDDSKTSYVPKEYVLGRKAYMLIY